MTDEDKELLIAQLVDAPSDLSDDELDKILADDELRELYNTSARLSGVFRRYHDFDIEAEWARFSPHIKRAPARPQWVVRIVAGLISIIVLSAIIAMTFDYIFSRDDSQYIAAADKSTILVLPKIAEPVPDSEPVKLAVPSAGKVSSVSTPDEADDDIDVDEYIRLQQAIIDNEIALLNANAIEEDYRVECLTNQPLADDNYFKLVRLPQLTIQ